MPFDRVFLFAQEIEANCRKNRQWEVSLKLFFALNNFTDIIDICWFRKLTRSNDEEWQLTLSYCKKEFILSTIYLAASVPIVVCLLGCSLVFEFNPHRLPFRIYFEWLPFAGIFFNWLLNYLYQICATTFAACLCFFYFVLILNIMNHSCWEENITSLLVQQLDKILDDEDCHDEAKAFRQILIAKKLKEIIDMTYRMIDYHDRVQSLTQFNFLIDFTLLSFVFCMCLFAINSIIFPVIVLLTGLSQIFIYCWIGNRVIVRYEALAASLYNVKWYLMTTKHQKDLQLILLRIQGMEGFNGIFKTVNLETFQKVCRNFTSDSHQW